MKNYNFGFYLIGTNDGMLKLKHILNLKFYNLMFLILFFNIILINLITIIIIILIIF